MKFSRTLLLVALAGLMTMDAVLAQKDDKEDALLDEADDMDGGPGGGPGGEPGPGGDNTNETMPAIMDDDDTNNMDNVPSGIDCDGAPSDADCDECLEAGCVMAVGTCMSSCSFIADTSCWDANSSGFRNMTVDGICTMMENSDSDNQLCAAKENCESCTDTMMTDDSSCSWYGFDGASGRDGYCGTGGCDGQGNCPVDVCDTEPTPDGGALPAEPTPDDGVEPCTQFPGCEPCLNSRMECAWIANSCQLNCDMIADETCYHPSSFPNMVGPQICALAADALEGDETDMEGGMATDGGTMVDDEGEEIMEGGPCNGFPACEPCLNSKMECSWIAGSCEANCDMIADAACYNPSSAGFANMTGPEICAIADEPVEGPTDGGMDEEEEPVDGEATAVDPDPAAEVKDDVATADAPEASTTNGEASAAEATEPISAANSGRITGIVAVISAASALFVIV